MKYRHGNLKYKFSEKLHERLANQHSRRVDWFCAREKVIDKVFKAIPVTYGEGAARFVVMDKVNAAF